jgi:hypothetical protein
MRGIMTTQILNTIQTFLRKKRISSIEKKRLQEDLETIYARLSKREYTIGGFSTNKFDVPDKTLEVFVNIDYYGKIGRTWARIFKELSVSRFHSIADICPGYTPKVELGLYYARYSGSVEVIDADKQSLIRLVAFMSVFRPEFKLHVSRKNIFAPSTVSYDVVTANHVLDDVILWHFARKLGVTLDEIYGSEQTYIRTWKQILSNKEKNIREITPLLVRSFDSLVRKGGFLCLAHYSSYTDRMLNQRKAYFFTQTVFHRVTDELASLGYTNKKELVNRALSTHREQFTERQCVVLKKTL